jgi:hypothetical protein
MSFYLIINISIILLSILFYSIIPNNENDDGTINLNTKIFITLSFVILWFVAGFRGDFTSDYKNYADLYDYFNSFDFINIFQMDFSQEIGYVIFSRFIGLFFKDSVFLMIATSFLILFLFYKELIRDSLCLWLSILLFINVGSYYTSFNIMRQIIAVAIVFGGSKYLYNRKLGKYIIIILIATLFHTTALIMLPFYFILNLKFNQRNITVMFASAIFAVIFLKPVIQIAVNLGFSRYSNYANGNFTYGMTGLNITSAVVPIAILIFSFLNHKIIDFEERKNNIWLNAIIFYAFFSVLGLKIQMLQRFAEFFTPYILLIIPLVISKINNKYLRTIYFFIIISLLIAFNYITLSGTGYDPFYFIWNLNATTK